MTFDNPAEKSKHDASEKPRVIGIAGLLILKGLLTGFLTVSSIQEINSVLNNPDYIVESWALPLSYGLLAISALLVLAAVLIFMYKKVGLYLGGALIVLDLALLVFSIANGTSSFGLALVIDGLILYYIYRYVTQEPDKLFFT